MTTDSLPSVATLSAELRPTAPAERPGTQPTPGIAMPLPQGSQNRPPRPWLGTDFAYTVVAR